MKSTGIAKASMSMDAGAQEGWTNKTEEVKRKEGEGNTEEMSTGSKEDENNRASINVAKDDSLGDEKHMVSEDAISVVEQGNSQNSVSVPTEKSNPISKQSYKGKITVPQPFSLSSKMKMSKSKSSIEGSTQGLSRSLSFRSKSPTHLRTVQTSLRMERITELREGKTKSGSIQRVLHTQTSLKVERSVELRDGNSKSEKKSKVRENQIEIKKLQKSLNPKEIEVSKPPLPFKATPLPSFYQRRSTASKSESTENSESEVETNKLGKSASFKAAKFSSFCRKKSVSLKPDSTEKVEKKSISRSSTFKATPLPSFYRKTASPQKPELIKIPITRSKSPSFATASKTKVDVGNNRPGSINNAASRLITDSAKENIKELLKGPWKAPARPSKSSKNMRPWCGDEGEKRVISSSLQKEGEMVVST